MKHGRIDILILADAGRQMGLLKDSLNSSGHVVTMLSSVSDALDCLENKTFDLAIVDMDLKDPGVKGFCKSLKKLLPDMPAILITEPSAPTVAGSPEPYGYIKKPFRIKQIESMIVDLLADKKTSDRPLPNTDLLVVDDDEAFRTLLIRSLQLAGYSAHGAADGKMAMELLEEGGIGIVIADINMPHMNGLALLEQIKRQWPQILVILVTGYYSIDDEPAEKEFQPNGFLMKPFKIQNIDDLLKILISSKHGPKNR